MEEVGNSNPVFLIIHKKAAIRSYLCSAFQKRSFLPLKQQKTMKNALFFMVFCLAAFSSAIMAAPDRACPCGAKLSAPLRARTSARERVRGSHKKRTALAVPFCVICERKGYTRCYFYCLYHIKLHRKNQRYSYKNVGGKFLRPRYFTRPVLLS